MTVFRVNKSRDYTVMSNHHLRDKSLTLKAKGLLSVMLSLPDEWDYSIAGLAAICKEGVSAVKSTLNELRDAGYMTIVKLYPNQTESGRIEYIYDIWESPIDAEQEGCRQELENQPLECQQVENRRQLNTKESSTEESNTENKKAKGQFSEAIDSYTDSSELRDALHEFVKMRKQIRAPMTERAVMLLFINLDKLATTDAEKVAVLDQSIQNSWRGVFELRPENRPKGVSRNDSPYSNLW